MENKRVKDMKIELLSSSPNIIKSLWFAARICYERGGLDELKEKYDKDKAKELLKNIYNRGHLSIFEQSFFQFNLEGVSRSLLAQFTRHRVGWSYAVQSQHYQKHDNFTFKDLEVYNSEEQKKEYYTLMNNINEFYKKSLANGTPRYIAREVLPNATSVNMITSTNLRALDHFWKLRLGKENTPEIREVAKRFYNLVIKREPILEDILNLYPGRT